MHPLIYVLVISLILTSLMAVRLRVRLLAHFDILCERKGFYSVRFFGIPLFSGILQLKGNKLYLTNHKGKSSRIKLSADATDEESIVNYLDNAFISIVDILDLDLYMTAGKSDDMAFSALATAVARIIAAVLVQALKNRNPRMQSSQGIVSDFENDEFYISVNSIITLSFADIIYSFIYANNRSVKAKEIKSFKEKVYD
ncbi:MAG: hypothetical protein GX756_03100 [Clostridiales bacterium]|jgi:hypothetical protein|nr:hypothetical protein [Clostridiales bacterium]